jgi:hypothetical protein
MIGYFPRCHPDELLYSVCARFAARLKYPSKKAISQELFDSVSATAVADLPTRLDSLTRRFPPRSSLTADRLMGEHTLLPFFTPFLPPERVRALREDMRGSRGSSVHMRSGVMAGRIPQPKWLRFCPACVVEDRSRFGETYWHRLHQLPGIEVCPPHVAFLEKSDARARHNTNPFHYLTAEKFARTAVPRLLDQSDPAHRALLKIAVNAAWLLGRRNLTSSLGTFRNRYLALLIERGLASYSGCIRSGKLLAEFRKHYPPFLLKTLRCEFGGTDQEKGNWLLHLVRRPKNSHHPLRHLLLINFFGISAEQFFSLPEEIKFFGDPPWPCLNPAADHFMEGVVAECGISFRGPEHRPVGTFCCNCGFTYARTGPDQTPEDRFRISKMKSFGLVWEQSLERLWADPALGISGVARNLGVDPLTVRRHADRLGLSLQRAGRNAAKALDSPLKLKGGNTGEAHGQKRRGQRRAWLSAMEINPKILMRSLRGELPSVYAWLLKNDGDWLKAHRPPRLKRGRANSSVDWGRRDARLAVAVRSKAVELLNAPGKPVFLSKTSICNSLGITSLLRQKINKLPQTAEALAAVAESRVEYAVRRVRWVAHRYLQEEAFPQRWRLILRANVYRWMSHPQVAEALDVAMEMFELEDSQMPLASAG